MKLNALRNMISTIIPRKNLRKSGKRNEKRSKMRRTRGAYSSRSDYSGSYQYTVYIHIQYITNHNKNKSKGYIDITIALDIEQRGR